MPDFETPDYRTLMELQKQLCAAYVHFARRIAYRSASMKHAAADRHHNMLTVFEDDALINACGRLMRFISKAKNKNLIRKNMAKSLEKLRTNIKDLRDMREHFDECCEPGGGQKPQEFVTEFQFASGEKTRTDAKWSVTIGPQEVLGGRIDVEKLGKALNELRQELEDESLWILVPWKADELAKTVSSEIDQLQNLPENSLSIPRS